MLSYELFFGLSADMTLVFLVGLSVCFELLVHTLPAQYTAARKVTALAAIAAIMVACLYLSLTSSNLLGVLLVGAGAYRIFNLARIVKGRMHAAHLYHHTFRTGIALIAFQVVAIILWLTFDAIHVSSFGLVMAALLMQAAMAVVSYHVVRGHSRRIQAVTDLPVVHDKDLPTLTVAVPARNETDALHACISSLLDSHYPKLEIIVLDDCSQTARTPEIIRDFAHKGVRFIRGTEPDGNWLAKNQAYAALVEASSGQLILFCGVDIRFTPDSLRRMVIYLLARRKTMLCVLPQNAQATSVPLIQPMRYLWELALPRRRLSRPPALSSCWLIARSALRQAGGFDAVARSVVPEAYFASRQTAGDGYSFMGGAGFGVSSAKSLREQRETAIRVTYPRLHKRPELVALVTALYVLWIGLPLSSLVYSLIFGQFGLLAMAALVGLIYSLLAYRLVLRLAYGYVSGRALLALPLAALVYIAILNYSMYKYEFSEVIWKGRNVCLPVMHVIPRLPKI